MFKRSLIAILSLGIALTMTANAVWAVGIRTVVRTLEAPFQADTSASQRIFDYSADFFQESKIASLDRMQRANGSVMVAFDYNTSRMGRESVPTVKFRWEYNQPTEQEIVSDGKTMWVYLPENNQVIQSDIEMIHKARQNDPMTFLTGLGNLSRDFSISWAYPNQDIDGNFILELLPIRPSALINRMLIVVDRYAVDAYIQRGKEEESSDPVIPIPSPPIPGSDFAFPGLDEGARDIWFPILSTTVYDPNGNSTIIEFSDIRVNNGYSSLAFDFIPPAGVNIVRPTGKEMGF